MAWRRWPSVFQDSVKNTVPPWQIKWPNDFCNFLATLCQSPPPPEHSSATAAAYGHRHRSRRCCRYHRHRAVSRWPLADAVAVIAVALVSLLPLPPRLPLPILVDCCVLSVSTAVSVAAVTVAVVRR